MKQVLLILVLSLSASFAEKLLVTDLFHASGALRNDTLGFAPPDSQLPSQLRAGQLRAFRFKTVTPYGISLLAQRGVHVMVLTQYHCQLFPSVNGMQPKEFEKMPQSQSLVTDLLWEEVTTAQPGKYGIPWWEPLHKKLPRTTILRIATQTFGPSYCHPNSSVFDSAEVVGGEEDSLWAAYGEYYFQSYRLERRIVDAVLLADKRFSETKLNRMVDSVMAVHGTGEWATIPVFYEIDPKNVPSLLYPGERICRNGKMYPRRPRSPSIRK